MSYPVFNSVPAGTTLYVPFATYDKDDGSSITMTGLAVTDIEIYKNGSATQRASDAGYTLLDTDGIDFDGVTGIHGFSIDLNDNTDAGFFVVGSWYQVVVASVTVDGVVVNFIAAVFRIGPAEATAGYPVVTHKVGTGTGELSLASGVVSATVPDTQKVDVNTIKTQAVTCGAGVAVAPFVGNATAAISVDANGRLDVIKIAGTTQTANDNGADINDILTDTGTTLDGRIPAALTANGNMKSSLVEILTTALTETSGYLAAAFKQFFNIATPTGTINVIPTVTTVTNQVTAAAMADAVWDEATAGHVAAGSAGELLQDIDNEVDYIHSAINSVAVTGSALNKEASSFVETINGTNTGAYTDTGVANGVLHTTQADASGDIDCHYVFILGVSGVPVRVNVTGQLLEPTAPMNNTVSLYAWNWTGTPAWELLHTAVFTGVTTAALETHADTLLSRHVETGVGTVKIRFYSTTLDTNAVLGIDQIIVEFSESIAADVAAILVDTGTTLDTLIKDVPTVAEFEARSLVAAGYASPTNITAGTITTVTTLTNDPTGVTTLLSRLGTPSDLGGGASVAANLVAIEGQTDDIGTAGAGLTAVPWNAAWDAEVQSEAQDAITASALATAAQLPSLVLTTGHAHAGGTASAFGTSLTNADNVWNDTLILFTSGNLAGQVKEIGDFANASGLITLTSGQVFTEAPADNDTFTIINR